MCFNYWLTDYLPLKFEWWKAGGTSFHPKAYLFKSKSHTTIIVGSSNLAKSALMSGIEWNLYAPSTFDAEIFETAALEFMNLFLSPNTVQLNSGQIARICPWASGVVLQRVSFNLKIGFSHRKLRWQKNMDRFYLSGWRRFVSIGCICILRGEVPCLKKLCNKWWI